MAKGTIDAAEYGSPIKMYKGLFSVQIHGTFVGTPVVQRASGLIDEADLAAGDWATVETGTADTDLVKTGEEGSIGWYRCGFSAYTSGSANWELVQIQGDLL